MRESVPVSEQSGRMLNPKPEPVSSVLGPDLEPRQEREYALQVGAPGSPPAPTSRGLREQRRRMDRDEIRSDPNRVAIG